MRNPEKRRRNVRSSEKKEGRRKKGFTQVKIRDYGGSPDTAVLQLVL